MAETLATLNDKVDQLLRLLDDLPRRLLVRANQIVVLGGLSDISETLGIIKAGEFRAGNRNEPGRGFSGMRLAYPPMAYSNDVWNLVGVENDVLQFGVRASDGKLLAGGGSVVLDQNGVTASAGTIAGWQIQPTKLVSPGTPGIQISSDGNIQTTDFTTDVKGWRIAKDGTAEFQNAKIRGELQTTIFTKREVQVTGGTLGIFKSAGVLLEDVTVTTGTFTIKIKDPQGAHERLFSVNDVLRLKDATNDTWVKVTAVTDSTTHYTYTVQYQSGTSGVTYYAGQAVANYGSSSSRSGHIILTADDTNAPFIALRKHANSPWTSVTELLKIGNLNGSWGYTSEKFGVAIGEYASGKANIVIDEDGSLRIRNYTTDIIRLSGLDATIENVLKLSGTSAALSIGASPPTSKTTGTGIWIDRDGIFMLKNSAQTFVASPATDTYEFFNQTIKLFPNRIRVGFNSPKVGVLEFYDKTSELSIVNIKTEYISNAMTHRSYYDINEYARAEINVNYTSPSIVGTSRAYLATSIETADLEKAAYRRSYITISSERNYMESVEIATVSYLTSRTAYLQMILFDSNQESRVVMAASSSYENSAFYELVSNPSYLQFSVSVGTLFGSKATFSVRKDASSTSVTSTSKNTQLGYAIDDFDNYRWLRLESTHDGLPVFYTNFSYPHDSKVPLGFSPPWLTYPAVVRYILHSFNPILNIIYSVEDFGLPAAYRRNLTAQTPWQGQAAFGTSNTVVNILEYYGTNSSNQYFYNTRGLSYFPSGGSNSLGILMWFYPRGSGGVLRGLLISGTTTPNFSLYINTSNQVVFDVYDSTNTLVQLVSNNSVTYNRWNYVFACYDRNSRMMIDLNRTVTNRSSAPTNQIRGSSGDFRLGYQTAAGVLNGQFGWTAIGLRMYEHYKTMINVSRPWHLGGA